MRLRVGEREKMEAAKFSDRRNAELRPLSPELLALIGQPVQGKAKLRKAKKAKPAVPEPKPQTTSSREERVEFYQSWEWRKLRMWALRKHGRICQCCGATPKHLTVGGERVRLVVDHIRPLGSWWHLRLDQNNVQVLCDECNMGKGGSRRDDFRALPLPLPKGTQMMSRDDSEVSELAMDIMASVVSGNLPRRVSYREMERLSEYECLVIDKAIRKQGRALHFAADGDVFSIENDER